VTTKPDSDVKEKDTMRGRVLFGAVLLAGFLVSAGCAKLNVEKTIEVPFAGEDRQEIDGFRSQQKINVTATVAAGGPVDVFVYLKKDEDEAEKAIFAKKDDHLLAFKRSVADEAKLEATIPANSPAVIYVGNIGKKATVKLKITN
jgi:hypothetical protein